MCNRLKTNINYDINFNNNLYSINFNNNLYNINLNNKSYMKYPKQINVKIRRQH